MTAQEIRIAFTMPPAEVAEAFRQYFGPQIYRRFLLVWLGLGFVLAAVVGGALAGGVDLYAAISWILPIWLLSLPIGGLMARAQIGRDSAPIFFEPTQLVLSDTEISVRRPNSSMTVQWQHFRAWHELPGYFVLAHAENAILVIPKHAVPAEDLPALRELLGRRIPPGGKGAQAQT